MITGLLGKSLKHSYSPEIHALFGSGNYRLFEREESALPAFFAEAAFDGLNVTIPYKTEVIRFLGELSETAKALGSVNTVVKRPDGTLFGDNTDVYGFLETVRKSNVSVSGKKVLVLGSGGASKAVQYALRLLGAKPVVVSRKGPVSYETLETEADASVIVNCTPVGMFPGNGEKPVCLGLFRRLEAVFDLIYNPLRTALLQEAESRDIPAVNGLYMLVAQAAKSHDLFTGTPVSADLIEETYRTVLGRKENVVLIGMPGAGKTTVARKLGEALGFPVYDSDAYVKEMTGKTPEEIILNEGEDAFRTLETKALSEISVKTGIVLSTGGGVVTRPENEAILKQNGRVWFLEREIGSLPKEGRPLSGGDLQTLYEARIDDYRRFADETAVNITIDGAVRAILKGRTERI
ncbi:MAG: AAA family ATPase [Lachnospiraceae bacterium]|nr:AAA family ATPase [Lachnospiraceae bacterium]